MNRRTLAGDRRRRKMITAGWFLALSVLVMVLIYLEMTAILYILCTVGVTVLLLIVAFSDLTGEETGEQVGQPKDVADQQLN